MNTKKILAGLLAIAIISLIAMGMYAIMGDVFISLMKAIFIVFVVLVAIFIGLCIWKFILYLINFIING